MLLDTCVLLWLVGEPDRLSIRARDAIATHAGSLIVSSISAFEIGVKVERGKLELPAAPGSWFDQALHLHGLDEVPVDGRIATRATALPRHHADPADRIIVATGLERRCAVVTPDDRIARYAGAGARVIW